MNIFDPTQWADVNGFMILMVVMAVTLFGALVKLVSAHWEDWLDERWGRGSVRDEWPFDRHERDPTNVGGRRDSPRRRIS